MLITPALGDTPGALPQLTLSKALWMAPRQPHLGLTCGLHIHTHAHICMCTCLPPSSPHNQAVTSELFRPALWEPLRGACLDTAALQLEAHFITRNLNIFISLCLIVLFFFFKTGFQPAVMVHAFNPSIQEVEAGGSL